MPRRKKKLFLESISEQTKSKKVSLFKGLVETKLKGKNFVESTKEIEANIIFYNDDVKRSQKLDEYKFTNFLSFKTCSGQKLRILDLIKNPSIVDSHNVTEVNLNAKVKSCLGLYVKVLSEDALIFKSAISNDFGDQLGVRVYTMFELPNNDPEMQSVFKIILIDPFHLVIPSKHKEDSKEVMEEKTYRLNYDNNICMSEWLEEQKLFI
ncbi:hypothetical protein [Paenibacillus kyungheensis]